ncbi:PrsW family glutamic-type intramembrane protease [Pseudonocardia tropica]|uniref:PrsW family glutamic-type intramembrane protease n=1 Tax=Pseudonocardia tropica TaxID=681289 RepID=A0ABV1JMW5_9PSEU
MSAPYGPRPRTPLPDVSVLFPWRAWTRHPWFRSWTTWVFVALIAAPPLAVSMSTTPSGDGDDLARAAFACYFGVAWFLVLRALIGPRGITGSTLAVVVGVALVVEAPLALTMERLLGASTLANDNVLLGIVTVGVPEEIAKVAPVLALALVQPQVWRRLLPREFLFLGAVGGLAFGVVEAIVYANAPYGTTGVVLVWRLLTNPVVHACWAGLTGYFIGLAARWTDPGARLALVAVGLGVAATLHGVNNAVADLSGFAWAVVVAVSALLFLGYAHVGLLAPGTGPRATTSGTPWAVGHPPAPVAVPRTAGHPSAPVVYPARPAPAPWSPPLRPGTPPSTTSGGVPDLPTTRLPVVGHP